MTLKKKQLLYFNQITTNEVMLRYDHCTMMLTNCALVKITPATGTKN